MRTFRLGLLSSAILVLAMALPVVAQRGDDAAKISKNGKAEGTIDGVQVTLEYGRPGVKGRKVWGGLVPYGAVWRTGADEATTIVFSADVMIEGEKLAAGTYGLFTLPGEQDWVVIFNKVANQWGAFNYDAGQDSLRVTTAARPAEHEENMSFAVEGSSIVLHWEKLAVAFEVKGAG